MEKTNLTNLNQLIETEIVKRTNEILTNETYLTELTKQVSSNLPSNVINNVISSVTENCNNNNVISVESATRQHITNVIKAVLTTAPPIILLNEKVHYDYIMGCLSLGSSGMRRRELLTNALLESIYDFGMESKIFGDFFRTGEQLNNFSFFIGKFFSDSANYNNYNNYNSNNNDLYSSIKLTLHKSFNIDEQIELFENYYEDKLIKLKIKDARELDKLKLLRAKEAKQLIIKQDKDRLYDEIKAKLH